MSKIRASLALLALSIPIQIGATMSASAQDTTEAATTLAKYPAVQAFYEAYNKKDASLLDAALAPTWVTTPKGFPDQPPGPDGMKAMFQGLGATFSTLTLDIQDVVVSGDIAVVRSDIEVVQSGLFLGVPSSTTPVTMQAIDMHRLGPDGKIVETWHVEDWLSYLVQRGALPLEAK